MEKCSRCKQFKQISEFYIDNSRKSRRDGRKSQCKPCSKYASNQWRISHPKEHALKRRIYSQKLRMEMILEYGSQCVCCGETRKEFLTLDHIFGGGNKDRKTRRGWAFYQLLRQQGWPKDKYRLLCWNCNCARGFSGYCPHDVEKEKNNEKNNPSNAVSCAVCI